jgi:nucleotide-binding universal stress UspA family protein
LQQQRHRIEDSRVLDGAPHGTSFAEIAMFKHILIATDGSELAGKAVTTGLALAKTLNAKVTAVNATEPWTAMVTGEAAIAFPIEEYEKSAAENAAKIFSQVGAAAKKQGVACGTAHVIDFPAEAIIETAKAKACDLIVMSSHGRRGIARMLLGSQATRVLTLSTVPVLICR